MSPTSQAIHFSLPVLPRQPEEAMTEMPSNSTSRRTSCTLSEKSAVATTPPLQQKYEPTFDELDATFDARSWSDGYKAWASTVYCIMILSTTYASSAYAPSAKQVRAHFDVSELLAISGTSFYVLGFALGPLLFGPTSEVFGRKPIYVVSFVLLTAAQLGVCLAPNISSLLVLRFFSGVFGSSALNNVASSIADMTSVRNRLRYNTAYRLVSFGGPTLGPLCGTFITENVGFRWNMRVLPIFSAVALLLYALTVPETHRATLLKRQQKRHLNKGGLELAVSAGMPADTPRLAQRMSVALRRPFIFLFTEPIIAVVCLYTSVLYGLLYGTLAAFPFVWQGIRGRSPQYASVTYLSLLGGFTLGAVLVGCLLQDRQFKREYDEGRSKPESRIGPATWIGFLVPVGLFLFAWTAPFDFLVGRTDIHYAVPCLAMVIFSMAMQVIFNSWLSYASDAYGDNSASAMAACTFSRSLCGAAFPLFMGPILDAASVEIIFTVFASVSVVLSFGSIAFVRYGPLLRQRSRYAKG